MKIGLFGGTFNPFHNGHIGISRHVLNTYGLDKIFFIPSATPPHKTNVDLAPAQDRYQMVKTSLAGYDHLLASEMELNRAGPSYTIDTINAFKKEHGPETDLYLLMGSDAFLDITTWKNKELLFKTINIIVMLRGEWRTIHPIASFIDENISKGYTFELADSVFFHRENQKIFICQVPRIDISSTMIREQIRNKKPIQGLVPVGVETMIRTKELYR